MHPFILYNNKAFFNNKKNNCFHILGFDILLDEKAKPWFIEVNSNPSLSIEHETSQ